MDSTSLASRRPDAGASAGSLAAFSLSSPGLSQDTPRFAGGRLSINTDNTGGISSTDSQRPFSNASFYYPRGNPPSQPRQQPPPAHHPPPEPWQALDSPSTTYTYGGEAQAQAQKGEPTTTTYSFASTAASSAQVPALSSPSPVSSTFTAAIAAPFPVPSQAPPVHHDHTLGQMNVSLNRQVSFGGQTSLVHESLARSPPPSHHLVPAQPSRTPQPPPPPPPPHWSPVRQVYPDSAPPPYSNNNSQRSSRSPTTHEGPFAHRASPGFPPTMMGGSGDGGHGRDLGGYGGAPGQGQHQHNQQHNQQNHGFSNTTLHSAMLQGGTSAGAADATLAYRHPSSGLTTTATMTTTTMTTTAPGFPPPKLSTVPTLPSHSPYPVYHPHHPQSQQDVSSAQQTLASPTDGLRIIPPLVPSQTGLSALSPSSMVYAAAGPRENHRGYPPYHQQQHQHQQHQQIPTGPVMSNIGNPGGQLTMFAGGTGLPYGGGGGGGGRKSFLYGGNHHVHTLSPTQMGHHHMGLAKGPLLSPQDRPFKCDECPQSFNRNHDLKRHKRIHLAVKPFPCNYCDKSFSRKDALKRHRLVKGCGEKVDVPPSSVNDGPDDSHRLR